MTQHGKLPHGHGSLRSLWSELPPEVVQSCVDIEHEHAWLVAMVLRFSYLHSHASLPSFWLLHHRLYCHFLHLLTALTLLIYYYDCHENVNRIADVQKLWENAAATIMLVKNWGWELYTWHPKSSANPPRRNRDVNFGKSTSSHELKPLGIAHRLQTFVLLLLMVALQTRARA